MESESKSELLKEIMDVFVDVVCLLFMQKMAYSFHYNYFLQQWHILLEFTAMYIFLGTCEVIR